MDCRKILWVILGRQLSDLTVGADAHIVPAEQADFTEVYGKFVTFSGRTCTGKRWTHIRNAPSSRTAVTGIGPYTG